MSRRPRRGSAGTGLYLLILAQACSLLAPSDRELMGGNAARGAVSGQDTLDGGNNDAGGAAGERETSGAPGQARGAAAGAEPAGHGGREPDVGGAGTAAAGRASQSSRSGGAGSAGVASGGASNSVAGGAAGEGGGGDRYVSCLELHEARPMLASGSYSIHPDLAANDLTVYCEMSQAGGGWTLILNQGATFDPMTDGSDDGAYYWMNGVSAAYSTLPVRSDIMFDMSEADIKGDAYYVRAIVLGIQDATRNDTLKNLFTTGPHFVEQEDNSNVTLVADGFDACDALPTDMQQLLCNPCSSATSCATSVITLGDGDAACSDSPRFAIGGSLADTVPWTNCAGWPQAPDYGGYVYYPSNFRIWVR